MVEANALKLTGVCFQRESFWSFVKLVTTTFLSAFPLQVTSPVKRRQRTLAPFGIASVPDKFEMTPCIICPLVAFVFDDSACYFCASTGRHCLINSKACFTLYQPMSKILRITRGAGFLVCLFCQWILSLANCSMSVQTTACLLLPHYEPQLPHPLLV